MLCVRGTAQSKQICMALENYLPKTGAIGTRCFSKSRLLGRPPAPKTKDRGPASKEDTQTDFNTLNVLGNMPPPTTAVDTCMETGFALNSGLRVTGAGVLLIAGEAFKWRPWWKEHRKLDVTRKDQAGEGEKSVTSSVGNLLNKKGQFDVGQHAFGILDLVWPKPDLLIVGTGASITPVSPQTRQQLNEMGIRIDVQDTRNAAAQYNMLATERGIQQVAAALVPIGWREGQ